MTAADAIPTETTPRRGNFIVRHWRGELPLWVSYWVIGIGGTVTVALFISGVDEALTRAAQGL